MAGVLLTAIILFAGCGNKKESGEEGGQKPGTKENPVTVFAVSTSTAVRGELKDYLEFGGDVTAKTNIDITPDTSGRVAEIRVRVGDRVSKNDIIALVDPSRPGMNFEFSPVKAPIDGTITQVLVVPGSMVAPQLSLAKVGRTDTLEIVMNVPERFVSKIQLNQQAVLRLDAYPGEIFPARVTEVSPVLDTTSRTMTVKLALLSPDSRIKAGMFARVKLITDTRTNTIKIQDTAVVTRFGESSVFIITEMTDEDGTSYMAVRKQKVIPGIRVDDRMEIRSGLQGGEEIVVRGQTLLEDGSRVNIVSRVPGLPEQESEK